MLFCILCYFIASHAQLVLSGNGRYHVFITCVAYQRWKKKCDPTYPSVADFFADWLFWFSSVSALETCITNELKYRIIMASKPFNLYSTCL